MNRYIFTEKTITQAKNYLKGKSKTQPSFLKKYKGEVKGKYLYLEGKPVIQDGKEEAYLRNLILKGKTPLSRDSAYYNIAKKVVNISRQKIQNFLKKQRIVRETDNQQATSKRGSRQLNKKGNLHYDLIEIKFKDLPFVPDELREVDAEKEGEEGEEEEVFKGYIFSMVDQLTSLGFFKWSSHKTQQKITPIAKEAFQFFSDKLDIPMNKLIAYSDRGKEFDFEKYKTWGIRTIQVKRSSVVENKNSHFQRVMYRIAKMKNTTDLKKIIRNAMSIVNKTPSRLTKKSPNENLKESTGALASKYNKKRGKDSGIKVKRKALKTGDKVRIQLLSNKDKGIGYKAYKGILWSKKNYKVQDKKGNRYKVNRKMYHRDQLRLSPDIDQKSEVLLKLKQKDLDKRREKEIADIRKKLDEEMKSDRKGAKTAVTKLRKMLDFWRNFDKIYGT